jgi:FKBP-type peptidyl-prolyl cis-trans isomerase FkpA
MKQVLFFSLLLIFTACNTYSDDQKKDFGKSAAEFARSKHWEITESESGLCSQILKEGTGEELVKSTSQLTIAYKGSLTNEMVFDKTLSSKPFKSDLRGLIGGMQEGLLNQKKGTKLRLIIPPHLGYGDQPLDKIPANSILVFEIEVLDLK